jgi:hypothetical protein
MQLLPILSFTVYGSYRLLLLVFICISFACNLAVGHRYPLLFAVVFIVLYSSDFDVCVIGSVRHVNIGCSCVL